MNETLKVNRVGKSKFGEYLLVDDGSEKGKFVGCTSQVLGFLNNRVPCSVVVEETQDIENRKGVVTRVKIVSNNSINEFEKPVEIVKPTEIVKANEYTAQNNRISDKERQESIIAQSCIKAALEMIKLHNDISEEKIVPNRTNIANNAEIVKLVYEELVGKKESEFPDY